MAWEQDLSEAQELENKLSAILSKYPGVKQVVTSSSIFGEDFSFPAWDIKIILEDSTEVLVELKNDKLAASTGNIAVEFARVINNEWKMTGISVSEATVWVQFFNDTYYAVETETLRKMIENKEYGRIQAGGQKNYARFYLFPVDKFKKYAIVIE